MSGLRTHEEVKKTVVKATVAASKVVPEAQAMACWQADPPPSGVPCPGGWTHTASSCWTCTPTTCAKEPLCAPGGRVQAGLPSGPCTASCFTGCDLGHPFSLDWQCTPTTDACGCATSCTATVTAKGVLDGCSGGASPTPTPAPTPTTCSSCSSGQYLCKVIHGHCSEGLTSQTYCAPDATCNGIQDIPICPAQDGSGFEYSFTATSCGGGGGSPTPSPTPGGGTPTPTPTPTPPPGTPTPTPGPGATPAPLYLDSGRYWSSGAGSNFLYDGTSEKYGKPVVLPDQPNPSPFAGADSIPSGDVIACVRSCPQSGSSGSTLDLSGLTPSCKCTAAGYTFNPQTWSCQSCPLGAIMVNGACQCPQGYSLSGNQCLPTTPPEYTDNPYPICAQGAGVQNSRLPTTYGMQVSSSSGTGTPRTIDSWVNPATQYKYLYSDPAVNSGGMTYPLYQYNGLPHCACMGSGALTAPLTTGTPTLSDPISGDSLDSIASFSSTGLPNKSYGMVAIAMDGQSDGRLASVFLNGNASNGAECGCPNVNEYPERVSTSNKLLGVVCKPVIPMTDPNLIFTTFNPSVDDISGKSQVYTRNKVTGLTNVIAGGYKEPMASGASPAVIQTISLPTSPAAPTQLGAYNRHIWKCQIGYNLNLTTNPPTCVWGSTSNNHKCDPSSPVAAGATWGNIINKKLACCMNDIATGATQSSTDVKFDCIDNSSVAGDFNALWESADPKAEGEEINALLLAGAGGKPLSGFYTLDGMRCNQFSEFDPNGIQPGMVNGNAAGNGGQQDFVNGSNGNTQFVAEGSVIKIPSGTGYNALIASAKSAGKTLVAPHPEKKTAVEIQNARQCPILVRAALVASCPPVANATNAVQYTVTNQPTGITRCPVADHVRIHIRAEQVYQISGSAPIQTVDTVIDNKDANAISLDQIIRQKNGSNCLPGMTSSGGGCHY